MSAPQVAAVVACLASVVLALGVSVAAWRSTRRLGVRLQTSSEGLRVRATDIDHRLSAARAALPGVDARAEQALWTLGKLDRRVDSVAAELTAKRAASDSLRVRLERGQIDIARLRELGRLLIRLSELRRDFL
jgi:hypothetical protein